MLSLSSRTVFYPSADRLCAATGDLATGTIRRESEFLLDEHGLEGALRAASTEYRSRARLIVPEEYLYLTQIEIPAADVTRSRLAELIGEVFPETLSDLAWDFEVVGEREGRSIVEVSGVTKDFGTLLSNAISAASVRLEAVIPESSTLARALPGNDAALLVHERASGTILCLIGDHEVVSSIVLDHLPTDQEVKEFLDFGRSHKHFEASKIFISGDFSGAEGAFGTGLSVVSLDAPLDVVRGALLIDLSSKSDAERLDLPIRTVTSPWYRRFFRF